MSQRHPVQNDHMMFITTNSFEQRKIFQDPADAREAIECLYRVQKLHPFFLFGFVIMPDHCHFLMFVESPVSISRIMNSYKSAVVQSTGAEKLWQPRFYMILPKKPLDTLRYIHLNPVKAKLVEKPEDYPWSSASGKWPIQPLAIGMLSGPGEN